MHVELSVERVVPTDELATLVARALGVDRERIAISTRARAGDFALHVELDLPDAIDLAAFHRSLAAALSCKLLVDVTRDHTATLVTATDTVRVTLEARDDGAVVIAGLHHVAYADDEVPDMLRPESLAATRGDLLAHQLAALPDTDAAAHPPRVQDAEHALVELLHALVHRVPTDDDLRTLRAASATLRRADPFGPLVACADLVLAGPWDPRAPAGD